MKLQNNSTSRDPDMFGIFQLFKVTNVHFLGTIVYIFKFNIFVIPPLLYVCYTELPWA